MSKQKININYSSLLFLFLALILLFSFFLFHETLPTFASRLIMMSEMVALFFSRYFQTRELKMSEVVTTFALLIFAALLF